jgi:hypothetical protein
MRIRRNQKYHLNRIELAVKLGKENIEVSPCFEFLFKERFLESEVVLLAEELSHAAVIVFKGANQGAFCVHPMNVFESAFLEGLLQTLCLTGLSYHFLGLSMVLNTRIIHGYYCILLLSL